MEHKLEISLSISINLTLVTMFGYEKINNITVFNQ